MHDHHEVQQIRHDQLYAAFRGLYVEAMEKNPQIIHLSIQMLQYMVEVIDHA